MFWPIVKWLTVGTLLAAIALSVILLWEKQSRKAAQAAAIAEYELGMKYFRGGAEVRIDHNKAIEQFRRAADAGLPEAQVELALLYHSGGGFDWLGAKDDRQAQLWANRALAGGLESKATGGDSRAQFALGELYLDGLPNGRDTAKAREWFERAAAAGSPDAERALGFIYYGGLGVPKDLRKAREHFERAAAANITGGLMFLALIYSYGDEGIPKDEGRAIGYLRRAAEGGSAAAQEELGECYEKGKGVPQSFITAAEYYRRAADRGFWAGLQHLAMLYESGNGVPRDTQKAAELYRALAARNLKEGKEGLERLEHPQPPPEPER
jgi:TPR repeat protein